MPFLMMLLIQYNLWFWPLFDLYVSLPFCIILLTSDLQVLMLFFIIQFDLWPLWLLFDLQVRRPFLMLLILTIDFWRPGTNALHLLSHQGSTETSLLSLCTNAFPHHVACPIWHLTFYLYLTSRCRCHSSSCYSSSLSSSSSTEHCTCVRTSRASSSSRLWQWSLFTFGCSLSCQPSPTGQLEVLVSNAI